MTHPAKVTEQLRKLLQEGLSIYDAAMQMNISHRSALSIVHKNDLPYFKRKPYKHEHYDHIKKMLIDGLTYKIIGERLGLKRNTVSSIVDRENLTGLSHHKIRTTKERKIPVFTPRFRESRKHRIPRKGTVSPDPLPSIDESQIVATVSIIDLERHQCKWPMQDSQFCGATRYGEKPYCYKHYIRSIDRNSPQQRQLELAAMQQWKAKK